MTTKFQTIEELKKEIEETEGSLGGITKRIRLQALLTQTEEMTKEELEFLEDIPESIEGLLYFIKEKEVKLAGKDLVKHIKERINKLKKELKN